MKMEDKRIDQKRNRDKRSKKKVIKQMVTLQQLYLWRRLHLFIYCLQIEKKTA